MLLCTKDTILLISYNKYQDVDKALKLDIYEGDVVDYQIFNTHPNQGVDDTTNFNMDSNYEEEISNFNEYPYVEFDANGSNIHGHG